MIDIDNIGTSKPKVTMKMLMKEMLQVSQLYATSLGMCACTNLAIVVSNIVWQVPEGKALPRNAK